MTAWVPLGDYSVSEGNLVVCEASHRLPAFHDDGEGESKVLLSPITHHLQLCIYDSRGVYVLPVWLVCA